MVVESDCLIVILFLKLNLLGLAIGQGLHSDLKLTLFPFFI